MAVNTNNFCQWNAEITTDGDMSVCAGSVLTHWTMDDTAPFGSNDEDWQCGSGVADPAGTTGPYTKGLSQSLTIKKGYKYVFNVLAAEGFDHNQVMYIIFVSGSNYQTVQTIDLINSNTQYDFTVTANNNYDKVMVIGYIPAGGTFSTIISKLKIHELDDCYYAPPLYKTDVIRMWMNFTIDSDDITFSTLRLGLYSNTLEKIYLYNISGLNQIIISGTIYTFYANAWTVPQLFNGTYRFVVYNSSSEDVIWYSNSFTKISNTKFTSIVKYKHDASILGYLYYTIPGFYNQFRIDIRTGNPNYTENVTGYETYKGSLIKTKSDIQKSVEFNTRYFDANTHEAFFSMLAHDEIYIDTIQYKKSQDSGYDITWSEDDDNKIGNGIVNLLVDDYSEAILTC